MNTRDLRYLLAVAQHGHFGRAAMACNVSQPTLSVQIRKLEALLGVSLFERSPRGVVPTSACTQLLPHARAAVAAADAIVTLAQARQDPLSGRFRLGIIPTLAPFLLPLIFAPLQDALPRLQLEPWEDQTDALLARLSTHDLDAALIATDPDGPHLSGRALFDEPFLAALPPDHRLANAPMVAEADLAADILVLSDGHCLRDQALAACGATGAYGGALRASSLPTLLNMVAAGYGTTLVPALASGAAQDAGIVLRPLASPVQRTVRIAWRTHHARGPAVLAVGDVVARRLQGLGTAA